VTELPAPPAPGAPTETRGTASADDPQVVIDLLGALSYAQLSGFEALAADAQMTPHLRAKLAFGRLAVGLFGRCERVGARLLELGVSHEEAMAPFAGTIDAFHERTAPSDWLEGVVKSYVGDGIVRDFHIEMATRLVGPDRDFIVDMLAPVGEPTAILLEVREAVAAEARVHGRLSLWARRIMGETLQSIQSLAVERDSLTGLLLGGEPGADINETGRMFTRLTEAHTLRMRDLGVAP
jgi:hypothetical protein